MINNVVFFETYKDLEVLTGLTEDGLWDNGFNLDDMDCGFMAPKGSFPVVEETDEYDYTSLVVPYDMNTPYYFDIILSQWSQHCVGYRITLYGDNIFVTLHHA